MRMPLLFGQHTCSHFMQAHTAVHASSLTCQLLSAASIFTTGLTATDTAAVCVLGSPVCCAAAAAADDVTHVAAGSSAVVAGTAAVAELLAAVAGGCCCAALACSLRGFTWTASAVDGALAAMPWCAPV